MEKRTKLLDDKYLEPYAEAIRGRRDHAFWLAERLAGKGGSLADWASAHEYYGLHRVRGGWTFREWAPNATEMYLVGDFSGWKLQRKFRLKRLNERDVFEGRFPADAIKHGQFYRLQVKWDGGEGERIPAYARRVVQDPATMLFSAQVWEPPKPYRWLNDAAVSKRSADFRPLVYEAHVGMATEEEKVGTYAEFRDLVLPRIKKAGYNVVQLMAIMEHPYYGSFGYHVSSFFAASSRFGTPEELKSLVDAAHGMGLMVIMDIVHSHAVKNERDGLSRFDGTDYQYFHSGPKGWHRAWDSRCFDYGKTDVLHFLLSNCRYWLDEFHFDGYRFDGVTSMLYWDHGLGEAFTNYGMYFNGSMDDDAWAYLQLANRVIHEAKPSAITIAEDVSGMPGCAAPAEDCGLGFDYRMAMGIPDYWFRLAEKVRDEDWNMHGMWYELTNKREEESVVSYVESHDQALVGGKSFIFQMIDADMYYGMGVGQHSLAVDRGIALHKMARLATLALSRYAYLNFMGNEFGHPEWIDFPRAENGWSYRHARRLWSLRDDPNLQFKALGDWDEKIVKSVRRREDPIPLVRNDPDHVLAFWRDGFLYVFNFDPVRSYTDYGVMVPPGGDYEWAYDSDEKRFGGQGRIEPRQRYVPEPVMVKGNELVLQIKLYLPARTATVLRRIPRKGRG